MATPIEPAVIRTLHLLRHAEAVSARGGQSDDLRPLSERGRRQATALATHTAALRIDAVVCSPALRTRETVAPLLACRPSDLPVLWPTAIYRSCVEGVIDLLLGTDPAVRHLLLVGHNPTISELVDALAGPGALPSGFAPATFVTLSFEGAWADLSEGRATLVAKDARAADLA